MKISFNKLIETTYFRGIYILSVFLRGKLALYLVISTKRLGGGHFRPLMVQSKKAQKNYAKASSTT